MVHKPEKKTKTKQQKPTKNLIGHRVLWAILGDSMVNGIEEKKHGNVKVFYLLGARINDMNHHLMPIIAKQPDYSTH